MTKRKAMTLVELILVSAFVAVLIMLSVTMFVMSARAQRIAYDEYDLQNSVRVTTTYIDRTIKEATAIFTIQEGRFFETNLTDGWDYFGLSPDKREVIRYVYGTRGGVTGHFREVLVPARPGITYSLDFYRPDPSRENYIGYKLTASSSATGVSTMEVGTALEARNSLQVVYRDTPLQKTDALAFRSDLRPATEAYGLVSFVVSRSDSMIFEDLTGAFARNFSIVDTGGGYSTDGLSKLVLLEHELRRVVMDLLANDDHMVMNIIPFSQTANYPSTDTGEPRPDDVPYAGHLEHPVFVSKSADSIRDAKKFFDEFVNLGSVPFGDGNTGDAYRRAYYSLHKMQEKYGVSEKYMIFITDGVTKTASGSRIGALFYGDGWFQFMQPPWMSPLGLTGVLSDAEAAALGRKYADYYATKIKAENVRSYVVGFSSDPADLVEIDHLADALGIDTPEKKAARVFKFTGSLNLKHVLDQIKEDIRRELWQVRGPQL